MDDCTNSWYATYVNYALQKDLMKGTSTTTFAPNVNMTRAQFVTILARAHDVPDSSAVAPVELVFSDVDVTSYYANAVAWAKDAGIIDGISATQFAPNAYITKQDMAKMMAQFADYANIVLPNGSAAPTFSDSASIATYAQASVNQLAEAGIFVGFNGKFNPKNNATRAEATKVLVELLN